MGAKQANKVMAKGYPSHRLLKSICNSPSGQVIRREFYSYNVSRQDFDRVLAHLSARVGQYLMLILQLHLIGAMRHVLNDLALYLNGFFLCHAQFTS
jgi:hypothetical protein